jgi:hypothetical protein
MYQRLPFCPLPEQKPSKKPTTLGERLEGDRPLKASIYNISFNVPMNEKVLCSRTLNGEQIKQFKEAIERSYYFEQLCDDLPIRGFIGFTDPPEPIMGAPENRYFLFTHVDFSISYNGNRVIQVNATSLRDRAVELTDKESQPIKFTYSVTWTSTNYPFRRRMNLYKDTFFAKELEIHWLSVLNSIVLVVLLTGFLAIIILRILRNDFLRYDSEPSSRSGSGGDAETGAAGGAADTDEYGWKLVHGDVFRFPANKTIFTSFIGIGLQFLGICLGLFSLSFMGVFHPEMGGSLYVAIIVLYALTSCIGGYFASNFYRQFGGQRWAWPVVLSATLFPAPLLSVFVFVNTVAINYGSTTALPFTTIIQVSSIVFFVGLPLGILGGIIGRRTADTFKAPCRTKAAVREIPPIPWYRTLPFQMIISGFLPFSAIYIELFYIYACAWGHSYYSLYGILFIVFLILLLVTGSITVALTYFQLSMEDYRWWWNSFACGGSAGLFVFAYSVFYYIYRTRMSGFLQGSFYFGYTACACYFLALMLGSIGFFASLFFVRYIYSKIKVD